MSDTTGADDGVVRCPWAQGDALLREYHDREWGVPVRDPGVMFERLILEGMQAGLSWRTVLAKRDNMARALFGFDPERLARAGADDLERWLDDASIIRNRAKLRAAVTNARAWLAQDDPVALLWSFTGGETVRNRWRAAAEVPAQTAASRSMSKALKSLGFSFVGPTICYALMQSAGLVNDHLEGCQFRQ